MPAAGAPVSPDPLSLGLDVADKVLGAITASAPTSSFATGRSQAISGIGTLVLPGGPAVDLVGRDEVLSVSTGSSLTSKVLFGVIVSLITAGVIAAVRK